MVLKMLTRLERSVAEFSENFNKERENIKRNKSELKTTVTKMS